MGTRTRQKNTAHTTPKHVRNVSSVGAKVVWWRQLTFSSLSAPLPRPDRYVRPTTGSQSQGKTKWLVEHNQPYFPRSRGRLEGNVFLKIVPRAFFCTPRPTTTTRDARRQGIKTIWLPSLLRWRVDINHGQAKKYAHLYRALARSSLAPLLPDSSVISMIPG